MKYPVFLGLLLTVGLANAASYDCAVTKKLDFENVYQPAQMEKYKFSARIHDSDKPKVDRCSRSDEHTSELQSHHELVCRLLLENKKKQSTDTR